MKIGIVGAGQVGATLIRQYAKAGHKIKMTNASGSGKLKVLEVETGAKALSPSEVVKSIAVLVISIPFTEIPRLASSIRNYITDETIIVDTTNYYPIRDGRIDEVENGMLESIWVSNHLSRPVVKVYNSILAGSLISEGMPKSAKNRVALPISGDDGKAKEVVASLVSDSGFDALDIGRLTESWKQQPGSPIYCTDLKISDLKANLDEVERDVLAERREIALQFILKQDPSEWSSWYRECVLNNRVVYRTALNN